MRIAYLLTDPGIPVFGNKGAAVHFRAVSSALAEIGHEVEVLAVDLSGDNGRDERINYHLIADAKRVRKKWRKLSTLLAAGCADSGSGFETDSLHLSEMAKIDLSLQAAENGLRLLKALPVDLILERLSPLSAAGSILAGRLDLPLVVEMNAPLTLEFQRWRGLAFPELSQRIEDSTLKGADGVIVVSLELQALLAESGICRKRVLCLPNGVDPAMFSPGPKDLELSSRLGLADKFVIGFCGSLKKWHGVDQLIRAFAKSAQRLSRPALLIVGDGPEAAELKALASSLGCEGQVVFTGGIPYEQVPVHIRLMDIAVAPYLKQRTFYFSPLKLFEYLASGVPVIASAEGQISSLLRNRVDSVLLSDVTPDSLSREMIRLHDQPELRLALARAGRRVVKGRSWKKNAVKMENFIRGILELRPS